MSEGQVVTMTDGTSNMYMPVAPANYGGDMFGGNSAWWIIILLIFGGWGNGFGGGYNGGYSDVQRGFDQNAVMNSLNGIQGAISGGFASAEIAANSRQLADMNQNFALQNEISDLKFSMATEACANRNAIGNAFRDVLEANNASTQKILDVMCQDKIDAKNETIAMLRQQLQMAELASSQNAQTATILANNEAQTAALERYLAPSPVPAYVVSNPNCCNGYSGCAYSGN